MGARRRACRAIACPRKVNPHIVFCNVHWVQLTPQLQQPITANREAPVLGTKTAAGKILGGIEVARAFLARKEGRGRQLKTAIQTQSVAIGQGGAGGTGSGTASGSSGQSTGGGGGNIGQSPGSTVYL